MRTVKSFLLNRELAGGAGEGWIKSGEDGSHAKVDVGLNASFELSIHSTSWSISSMYNIVAKMSRNL